jgi:hypothetical protein
MLVSSWYAAAEVAISSVHVTTEVLVVGKAVEDIVKAIRHTCC